MTIKQRVQSPTPRFFKKVRNAGLVLAAISATILAAPIALPAVVTQTAGYLAVAATAASAVSQTTSGGKRTAKRKHGRFSK
jgi:hypothetical protein